MKYNPKNTLGFYQGTPQFQQLDLSGIPVTVFSAAGLEYRKDWGGGKAHPEDDALTFYTQNHLASIVRSVFTLNEPLPEWAVKVMDAYLDTVAAHTLRNFHYIIAVITREMRHIGQTSDWASKLDEICKIVGENFKTFIKTIKSDDENEAVDYLLQNAHNIPIDLWCQGMVFLFNKTSWGVGSTSYGGKKWGNIAQSALDFVVGKNTMEMMVDVAYTLAHNGAPMYNKGMHYHQQDSTILKTVLDVQRSGQMPEFVLDGETYGVAIPEYLKTLVQLVDKECPGKFGKWVDWVKVEKLGALNNYNSYKAKQLKLHPVAPEVIKSPL